MAIEQGTRNHEIVSVEMVKKLSNISCNFSKICYELVKNGYIRYETQPYLGYTLRLEGYDCLAIHALRKRGLMVLGDKVGVGKESDVYYGVYNEKKVVIKFHRVGRTSFRTVKNNRDYHGNKKHCSWQELSRISARTEYEYMVLFYNYLDIPKPYDCNRHLVVMEYLENYNLLNNVTSCDLDVVYNKLIDFIESLWMIGYVHGDFNEFNILINDKNDVKIIDLPQCIKNTHSKANEYLIRDFNCIKIFFERKFRYVNESRNLNLFEEEKASIKEAFSKKID